MREPVLIVVAGKKDCSIALQRLSGDSFSWAYLGQSIVEFEQARTRFGAFGTYIETTGLIHQASEILREPYLEFLYRIGREVNSLLWWVTSLSYRNGVVTKTFLQTCYLKVALDLVNKRVSGQSLVLVASEPVCRVLEHNLARDQRVTLGLGPRLPHIFRFAKDAVNLLAHRIYFLLREAYRILQARLMVRRPVLPEGFTVLFAWATRENLGQDGEFHKSFFGELADGLEELGCQVAIAPIILQDVRYKEALHRLRRTPFPLLVPHRYLRFWDLVRTVASSFARAPRPRSLPLLSGMDIKTLVDEDLRLHWISNGAADALLMAALVRRWAALGFHISRFIYIYENQPYERAICWEVARSMPEAEVVGYQHAGVPQMLLNFWLAHEGESEAPLPHRIVTVGRHTARQLSNDGHSSSSIRVGGALQLQGLLALRHRSADAPASRDRAAVLVASSDCLEEAAELVYMAGNLFEEDEGISVVVKCHPRMPFKRVADLTGLHLPDHVMLSEEPIADLMLESSIMVYSGSTVGIQALALGLPVVHLRTQFDLDLDPLDAVPHLRLEATGLEELREKVRWLVTHGKEYVDQRQVEWDRLIEDFYGPVTVQTYRAFLE